MSGYKIALIVGIVVSLVGAGLTIRLAVRRWRELKTGRHTPRLESLAELLGPTLIFGGMATEQVASLASHTLDKLAPNVGGLTIAGTTSGILMFGVFLGRLITRWQLRQFHGLIDTDTGVIRPHA